MPRYNIQATPRHNYTSTVFKRLTQVDDVTMKTLFIHMQPSDPHGTQAPDPGLLTLLSGLHSTNESPEGGHVPLGECVANGAITFAKAMSPGDPAATFHPAANSFCLIFNSVV